MAGLDTTNLILAIIAVSALAQLILLVGAAVWVTRATRRLSALQSRVDAVLEDFHTIAQRTDRVGLEIERTARGAQAIVNLVGYEVERGTRGVHVALNAIEGGFRGLSAVGAGLRAGVRELFRRRQKNDRLDEDAIARFDAGA